MASSVERHFTPTYDLNGWNDEQSNNSIVLRPENFSIYDEEDSLDYDQIRPISAPSLANWYSTDFNENFDFNNEYDYTPAYTLPSNSVFNFQPRTVPRFYDSTTYRDHFVGYEQRKVQTPEFQDDHNTNLPAFNGETTNQATYLPHDQEQEAVTLDMLNNYRRSKLKLLTEMPTLPTLATADQTATRSDCPMVAVTECCQQVWSRNCPQPHCYKPIVQDCPERKSLVFSANASEIKDLRRAPQKAQEPKCGTAEFNYAPCTSNGIANNLFKSCCELYVPPECHAFCKYETDQKEAKELMIQMSNSKCHFKHLSSIFYCASQNRDNKQCCTDLGLSDPALMVGSRCLRFCDPSGTSIGRITKEDVTCLFNLGVINFCHRSGIREIHMRYKHLDTYTKVQSEDERVRDQMKRSDAGQIVSGAQKRKRKSTSSLESGGLTIEQLTSLLIPPSINFDVEETSHTREALESPSVAVESTVNVDEPLELNKKLKLRSVELVFDVEGSESIRLSLPCNRESTTRSFRCCTSCLLTVEIERSTSKMDAANVVDDFVDSADLENFRRAYEDQVRRGDASAIVAFNYAHALIRSTKENVKTGIYIMESLLKKDSEDVPKRDYEYDRALSYVDVLLSAESDNRQAIALKKLINERMKKESLLGLAVLGFGGALAIGGAIAAGALLSRRH
ncbi:DB domain-containing protein [Aphelenchoides besseyi]|nr:DB domain-containing protein [Aphelenchoides besseyi]